MIIVYGVYLYKKKLKSFFIIIFILNLLSSNLIELLLIQIWLYFTYYCVIHIIYCIILYTYTNILFWLFKPLSSAGCSSSHITFSSAHSTYSFMHYCIHTYTSKFIIYIHIYIHTMYITMYICTYSCQWL